MCEQLLVNTTKKEIYQELTEKGFLNGIDFDSIMENMNFYEFDLKQLGLPDVTDLLKSVKKIEESVGIQGWENKGKFSKGYQGFSLTYNPDFFDKKKSLYHQTWGAGTLVQNFSRTIDPHNEPGLKKNTYYDTYGFRKIPKIVKINLAPLLKKLSMPLLRSRAAYIFYNDKNSEESVDWHKDEFPYQLLRINIPLSSEPCYVLDIDGQDEHGNSLKLYDKYLEPGKMYIWNTRIPHRIRIKEKPESRDPRIAIVLGLSPYFQYEESTDSFLKSNFWGLNLDNIIKKQLFLNK